MHFNNPSPSFLFACFLCYAADTQLYVALDPREQSPVLFYRNQSEGLISVTVINGEKCIT